MSLLRRLWGKLPTAPAGEVVAVKVTDDNGTYIAVKLDDPAPTVRIGQRFIGVK